MPINPTTLKALIDTQITNETVDFAITPTEVGSRMKDTIDYTTEQIALAEVLTNKSTNVTTDGASDTKYPSVKAVKDYVDANSGGGTFLVYSALISQSGTSNPTLKELENTTGVTFSCTRGSTGNYTLTGSSNVFTADKTATIYSFNSNGSFPDGTMFFYSIGAQFFTIETRNSGTPTDGVVTDAFIEIRIYP